jgi:hypothetical protein
MATMGRYCKAYPASVLRKFSGWKERPLAEGAAIPLAPEEGASADEGGDVCLFIQENLVVTGDVFKDEHVVFDEVTPEWKQFCKQELQFEVPESELPDMPDAAPSESAESH